MNPCPVRDARTGTVFLFFVAVRGRTPEAAQLAAGRNAARLCCVASRDAGQSWGGARDLTAEAVGGAERGRRGAAGAGGRGPGRGGGGVQGPRRGRGAREPGARTGRGRGWHCRSGTVWLQAPGLPPRPGLQDTDSLCEAGSPPEPIIPGSGCG